MYVSRGRQHLIYRGQIGGASVLAALLSALLLLSPGTARAVAHVLVENGVPLPANVVRILDTMPSDPARDTLRRDEEVVGIVEHEISATLDDEPDPVSVGWALDCRVPVTAPIPLLSPVSAQKPGEFTRSASRHSVRSRIPPRAPPV